MTFGMRMVVILVMLVGMFLVGGPAPAMAQTRCAQDLRDCYIEASQMRYWVDRWLAGIDCEFDFVECARRKLIGR